MNDRGPKVEDYKSGKKGRGKGMIHSPSLFECKGKMVGQ